MSIKKLTAQNAINYIDGTLIRQLPFSRIDESNRSKAHFFEIGNNGKQFAVVVGDKKEDGKYSIQQTRVLLEELPTEISDVLAIPIQNYWLASPVTRSYSRLNKPRQRSVLVSSEAGLRSLLEWYTGSHRVTEALAPNAAVLFSDKDHDGQNRLIGQEKRQSTNMNADSQTQRLCAELNKESDQIAVTYANKPGEDVDAIVKRRIGQGLFRELLMKIDGGKCWLSGLTKSQLLIASHIISWSESTGEQKTDPENGLLLSISWDALFDKGFISFDDQGTLLCSPEFDALTAEQLGVSKTARLPANMLTERRRKNLSQHRQKHRFES